MGWEVFYHTTFILIPTPTRSTELTSKGEGNCNVMIAEPSSHGCMWSSHTSSLSSSPPLWALLRTASSSLQPYYHTYETSPPNRLKTRVAIMPINQTDAACWSNVGRNLGGVQSMSMVTTQPFADCEKAVECHLTYSVFCIAKKPSSVIWPIRCFA